MTIKLNALDKIAIKLNGEAMPSFHEQIEENKDGRSDDASQQVLQLLSEKEIIHKIREEEKKSAFR